jgi:hypothetical protein
MRVTARDAGKTVTLAASGEGEGCLARPVRADPVSGHRDAVGARRREIVMRTQTMRIADASAVAPSGPRSARPALAVMTACAVLVGCAAAVRGPTATVDPDLVRVIRFMALIKGGLALAAFAGCFWRLARPAALWRMPVYVAGPPVMAAGAIGLWSLHDLGLAALGLHLGLFAVLAAALTDPAFLPDLSRRRSSGSAL